MNNALKIILAFIVIVLILGVISLLKDDPVNLSLSLNPCLGKTICFFGETLKLNVLLNSKDLDILGKNRTVYIDSVFGKKPESVTIGNFSEIDIPIETSLSEGNYKISVSSDFINNKDLLLKIKYLILGFFGQKYQASKSIEIRYPLMKVNTVGYQCNARGFYFEEIKLKLEDPYITELNCKLRIYVDKFVTTNHNLLTKIDYTDQFDYYESNYSKINKLDLTGSVQKISFFAGPAVQQTNTRIVPVCLINGQNIEIKTQEIKMPKCPMSD